MIDGKIFDEERQQAAEKFADAMNKLEAADRALRDALTEQEKAKKWLTECEDELKKGVGRNRPRKLYKVKDNKIVLIQQIGETIVVTLESIS